MAVEPIPTFANEAATALLRSESFFLVVLGRDEDGTHLATTYTRTGSRPGASATLIGEAFKGLTRAALEGDDE